MILQHTCENCGADMVFDADTGKLTCGSCQSIINIEDTEGNSKFDTPTQDFENIYEKRSANEYTSQSNAKEFLCNSCGAVLVTDGDTSATICSFCGSAMVITDRLIGSLAPAKIIPFTISKARAQEAFKKWCKNGLVTPTGFMTAERIKNISGVYVPFWLYDLNGRGEGNASCTKVRTRTSGDYIITDTRHYQVYRRIEVNFLKIPADASKKMDDELMDKLEPFNYNNLEDFRFEYLSGFISEKYNYTDKDLFPRINSRVDSYIKDYMSSTISGYNSTIYTNYWSDLKQRNAYYTLLPVWLVNYDYKGKEYMFAMNGQTGKIVGKPPISWSKIAMWYGGTSVGMFLLLEILSILGRIV